MEERERKIRKDLVEYGKKLVETGLVQGTWGNLSARLDEKHMIVTPSGLDYARLTPDDMAKVNYFNLKYSGNLKPTSEKGIHAALYRERLDVDAVIHTHSKYCSIFAAAKKDVPIISDEGIEVFGNLVRCSEYGLPGTAKIVKKTMKGIGKGTGTVMANHGMIVVGGSIETAFVNCKLLETCAKVYIENN